MAYCSHPSKAVKLALYNGEHWTCLRDYLGQGWEETQNSGDGTAQQRRSHAFSEHEV